MGPIVCCVDDSDGSRRALATARELASGLGVELVLLHVAPPTEAPGVSAAAAGQERLREDELRTADELLARLSHEAGLTGQPRRRTAVGRAAETIVAVCEDEGAGLVVLGSRGRGGLAAAVLGSVSATVAATAPCPCVVVPP